MKHSFLCLALTLLVLPRVCAWDAVGHRIVADIAYHHLSEHARTRVDAVLGYKRAMVATSSWADAIQSDTIYPGQTRWHYQDIDGGRTPKDIQYLYEHKKAEGVHLFFAKDSLYRLLKSDPDNADALKFYVHFSGDGYQPMHMGHHDDLGGNRLTIYWFGKRTNLHTLWDQYLIDYSHYSSTEYTDYLCCKYAARTQEISQWTELQCFQRTYELSSAIYAYYDKLSASLDERGYFPKGWEYRCAYTFQPELEIQLYMAGVQLAKFLNELY